MSTNSPNAKYRLYSQQSDDMITLVNLITGTHLVISAAQVLDNPDIMAALSKEDLSIIRFISTKATELHEFPLNL